MPDKSGIKLVYASARTNYTTKRVVLSEFQNNAKKNNTKEKESICIAASTPQLCDLLDSMQVALSCTCTITVSHLYFRPRFLLIFLKPLCIFPR